MTESAIELEIPEDVRSFDFNITKDAQLKIQGRVQREIWRSDKKLIEKLESAFKELMITNIIKIRSNEQPYQAPALLDLYWWDCILYSKRYQEFSHLIGVTLDRNPSKRDNVSYTIMRSIFPKYDYSQEALDYQSYVWVLIKDIDDVIMSLFSLINEEFSQEGKLYVTEEKMFQYQDYTRKQISSKYVTISQQTPMSEEIDRFIKDVRKDLPEQLIHIMEQRFCRQNPVDYIDEYLKFLALIKFCKSTFSPSESVDLVWHTHQGFTENYRMVCEKHIGLFVHHNPTTGGQESANVLNDQYGDTLRIYETVFNCKPRIDIWPDGQTRFDSKTFLGSWISLRRLIFALFQVIRIQPQDKVKNVVLFLTGQLYDDWEGTNPLKTEPLIITSEGVRKENDRYYF